jgi:hypothetical protein
MFSNSAGSGARSSGGQSTLDLLNFENVRNQGIIETPTSYTMLVEVEPREWLTLSEQRRSNLYVAYLTYLRGLSFPTQVFTITTSFDAQQYYGQFVGNVHNVDNVDNHEGDGTESPAQSVSPTRSESGEDSIGGDGEEAAADGGISDTVDSVDDSPLLEYGRYAHAEWLDQTLRLGEVRDRRFLVAVGVTKGEEESGNGGRFDAIREMFPGGGPPREVPNEDPYLDEVWARAHRVAAQLPRTEVATDVLASRSEVLDVLYHYYRGHESPISFDHSVFTKPDESTLTDPLTHEPLDLESAFEQADRRDELTDEQPAIRPKSQEDPFDGRVAPEFVPRVSGSRLLQWYAQHIAPIGNGPRYTTPVSVYAGALMFLLGIFLGAGAFLAFTASGAPQVTTAGSGDSLLLREGSFILVASAVPVFFLSLVVLLPSSRIVQAVGGIGTAVSGAAIYLFQEAYPAAWDVSDMARTTTVLEIYGVGILVLIVVVALSLRHRRSALSSLPSGTQSAVTDGGASAIAQSEPSERESADETDSEDLDQEA